MNKIGIHYGSFVSNWMDEQFPLIKKVKDLGFDLLEMGAGYLTGLDEAGIARLKEEAEKQNVDLTLSLGLNPSEDIGSPNKEYRDAGKKILADTAMAMHKAGISDCSGILYSAWNGHVNSATERNEYWKRSVRSMKEVSKIFEDENVYFNLEVANRFESFLINDCTSALEFRNEVGSDHIGIHLDTFHMNIEENSMVDAITRAKDHLRYFHIGENNRRFPGLGTMPWKTVFDTLKAVNYTHPISMEVFVKTNNQVASAVSLFRDIHETDNYEEDIKTSLTFVRNLMR